ncbi:MAG: hypothetical protein CTY12_00325 [Methylotenera sp.]|nr:MAG: hypothetical protein CTY12_00325 [Methylotenera sp.]
MFGLFKKKQVGPTVEERLNTLETKLQEETEAKIQLEQELESASSELTVLREQVKEHEDKKNSTEPWVEVVGESIDPVRGIQIKLDWNDAFIQYLKENGITGKDEDTAIQKWLALLYHDLVDNLEQRIIDNSDKYENRASEYL